MNELLEVIAKLDEEEQAKILALAKEILAHKDNMPEQELADEQISNPPASFFYDVNQTVFMPENIQAIINQFPKNKQWTVEDIFDERIFPQEANLKIEIHNHKIYVMFPTTTHQKVLTNLTIFMGSFIKMNDLGEVYVSPVLIKMDDDKFYAPDIFFISVETIKNNPEIISEKLINGIPDLVVEVISPANYRKLRLAKKEVYAQSGVKEYWEIRPKKQSITIEKLENGEFVLFSEAKKQGKIQSSVLEGFSLDVAKVFE